MKIEQLLVQHFYNHREITLQGMGTFTLSPDFVMPADNDKEMQMPDHTINFHFNPKATEDNELIDFIVQHSRKIKPLASADLDSYLVLGKQFLNIGKPFIIEGLGILEKTQQGDYQFKQGQYSNTKLEAVPVELKEKADDDISFAAIKHSRPGKRKGFFIIASILLIGGIAVGIWYYLHQKENKDEPLPSNRELINNPVSTILDTATAVVQKKDTINTVLSNPPDEGYTFKVVFKENIDKVSAITRMDDLNSKKHNVIMYTKDSVYYKLAEPFKLPLSDTSRIKDSLKKVYYRYAKVYIELY